MTGDPEIKNNIHPTALVSKKAELSPNITIGPFSVVEDNTYIGEGTTIFSHSIIKSHTTIGKNCRVFQGAVLGEIPQDIKFENEISKLTIGKNTTIREYTTLNRGTKERGETTIGSNVLLMAYVHIGHDCEVKDNAILANGVQLGGHVTVGNNASIGGMTPVHQFCKVGDHAFIGGGFRAVQDVPPYVLAAGEPLKFNGINSIGLRRKGFKPEVRKNIKAAYNLIYRSEFNLTKAIEEIQNQLPSLPEIQNILEFLEESDRGIIS